MNKKVTYSIKVNDKYIFIDNVPVTIDSETGEYLYSEKTLNKLSKIVLKQHSIDQSLYYDFDNPL